MLPPDVNVVMARAPSSSRVLLLAMLPAAGRFSPGESAMVTCRVSETSTASSFTVRVTVNVVFATTLGAVNEVDSAARFASVTPDGPSWVHSYVRSSPVSTSVAVPERVTLSPSPTVWSRPASTVGELLRVTRESSPARRRIWTPSSTDEATAA